MYTEEEKAVNNVIESLIKQLLSFHARPDCLGYAIDVAVCEAGERLKFELIARNLYEQLQAQNHLPVVGDLLKCLHAMLHNLPFEADDLVCALHRQMSYLRAHLHTMYDLPTLIRTLQEKCYALGFEHMFLDNTNSKNNPLLPLLLILLPMKDLNIAQEVAGKTSIGSANPWTCTITFKYPLFHQHFAKERDIKPTRFK